MKIVFPWAFDPFHVWHRSIVLKNEDKFWEEVWVLITNDNPLKCGYGNMSMRVEIAQGLLQRETNVYPIRTRVELLNALRTADYILKWHGRNTTTELKDLYSILQRFYLFPFCYKLLLTKSDSSVSSSWLKSLVALWDTDTPLEYTTEQWVELLKKKLWL